MESWHSVYNAVDVNTAYNNFIEIIDNFVQQMLSNHQSINQCLFSIQTNNNTIHTFINMNTERAGREVILLI